jgi:hypothetical protein
MMRRPQSASPIKHTVTIYRNGDRITKHCEDKWFVWLSRHHWLSAQEPWPLPAHPLTPTVINVFYSVKVFAKKSLSSGHLSLRLTWRPDTLLFSVILPSSCRHISGQYFRLWATRQRSWLKHYAWSQKVAGTICDGVSEIFYWLNRSRCIMAAVSTHPLTEMSYRDLPPGVGSLPPSCFGCLKILGASNSWNHVGLSRPVQR